MLIDFRQLWPKYNIAPKGVLHVGANIGEEAPVYLEMGVKRQIWVEANPEIYERLKANIANNPEAKAMLFAAWDETKPGVLHESSNAGQSSSILDLGTHAIAHPDVKYIRDIDVPLMRLDSFQFADCDFLNIDIQGAELKALKGMGKLLEQFKWAYLEVNKEELYKGCALVGEIDSYLSGYGFERVETLWAGNTGWGDALYIKK